jgi:putative ABC transport system permease protein
MEAPSAESGVRGVGASLFANGTANPMNEHDEAGRFWKSKTFGAPATVLVLITQPPVGTDIRLAARSLVGARGFTTTALVALTLGIAANILAFTLLNGVFLHPLPYASPDELVAIRASDVTRGQSRGLSYLDLADLEAAMPAALRSMAGVDESSVSVADAAGPAERLRAAYVSAETFALLGVRPVVGRNFTRDDDRPQAEVVTILGHHLWQRRYQGDTSLIGRTVRINGIPATVIGVMPSGFGFPQNAELWQPLAKLPVSTRTRRDARVLNVVGRLAPTGSLDAVGTALNIVAATLARQHPETNANISFGVRPYRQDVVGGRAATVFPTLMGAVSFLLLMACANVANLLLARGNGRAREIAVRLSIGGSRGDIIRQLLLESLLLSMIASALGFAIGAAAVRVFSAAFTAMEPPFWLSFPIDAHVIGFVVLTALMTTVVFGLMPAIHTSKVNLADLLNESGRGASSGRRTQRWSGSLVVVQVALALILVTSGTLLIRAGLAHSQRDAGIDTDGLLTMRIELPEQRYRTPADRTTFYERLDERLTDLPAASAAIATPAPRLGGPERWLLVDGSRPTADARLRPRVTTVAVGRRYFETLRIDVLQGRLFDQFDGRPGRPSVIVNARFVERFVGGRPAVGQQIELGPDGPDIGPTGWLTIVGVVPNVRQNDEEEGPFDAVAYLPFAADPLPNAMLIARSRGETAAVTASLRDLVTSIDPDLPIFAISTLDDVLAAEGWPLRIFGTLYVSFATVALTLAVLGLYAVTAYAMARRTREIGIRVALGAQPAHIWWTVSRRVSLQVALGIIIGFAGTLALGELLASTLVGVSPRDPSTLASVPLLLAAVAAGACLIPARRAMQLNPTEALRHDQ